MNDENPFMKAYTPLPDVVLKRENSALLIVDVQYLCAHKDYGPFVAAKKKGEEAAMEYFKDRLDVVVPNIAAVQKAFREKGMEVIFAKIESYTLDGRERSRGHKAKGIFAAKGSKEAQILEEIKPLENEIVFPKTAAGVFNATPIDQILRNMGIENLFITGVVTNNCVENAVRDACDRGYSVVLIEDGCTAMTEDLHRASIRALTDHFAKIKSSGEVIDIINALP